MYPEEPKERETRLAIEARRDPGSRAGAIKRIADQLGIRPKPGAPRFAREEIDGGNRPAPPPMRRSGSPCSSGRTETCVAPRDSENGVGVFSAAELDRKLE